MIRPNLARQPCVFYELLRLGIAPVFPKVNVPISDLNATSKANSLGDNADFDFHQFGERGDEKVTFFSNQ